MNLSDTIYLNLISGYWLVEPIPGYILINPYGLPLFKELLLGSNRYKKQNALHLSGGRCVYSCVNFVCYYHQALKSISEMTVS